jgi:hypothetical protein
MHHAVVHEVRHRAGAQKDHHVSVANGGKGRYATTATTGTMSPSTKIGTRPTHKKDYHANATDGGHGGYVA